MELALAIFAFGESAATRDLRLLRSLQIHCLSQSSVASRRARFGSIARFERVAFGASRPADAFGRDFRSWRFGSGEFVERLSRFSLRENAFALSRPSPMRASAAGAACSRIGFRRFLPPGVCPKRLAAVLACLWQAADFCSAFRLRFFGAKRRKTHCLSRSSVASWRVRSGLIARFEPVAFGASLRCSAFRPRFSPRSGENSLVARGRIELPTRGFSVRSADDPRHQINDLTKSPVPNIAGLCATMHSSYPQNSRTLNR